MIKTFEFYFDFGSPYTFLAHKEIRKIEKENSIKVKYMPVLLGGLQKLAGTKPNIDIPIKAKYMIKDCKLWAEKYKTSFKFNNYFPIFTLKLMRCALVAENKGFDKIFINKIFDAIWKDGLNMNDQIIIDKVIKNMDINPKTFLLRSADIKIKDKLKKLTDDALRKGIFGAPTFLINKKIFWGQDRLSYAVNEVEK